MGWLRKKRASKEEPSIEPYGVLARDGPIKVYVWKNYRQVGDKEPVFHSYLVECRYYKDGEHLHTAIPMPLHRMESMEDVAHKIKRLVGPRTDYELIFRRKIEKTTEAYEDMPDSRKAELRQMVDSLEAKV